MRFFPYAPRPHQRGLLELLQGAARSQAHVVVEAPPGSGKTACALASALQEAQAAGARVVYATRTNSQQAHVMAEFRRVREAAGLPLVGVPLQGRRHQCLRLGDEPALAEADPEEFARMCLDRRQAAELRVLGAAPAGPVRAVAPPCPWYEQVLRRGYLDVEQWAQDTAPTAEELAARCAAAGLCPDHVARAMLQDAALVVCSYPYLLHPGLRAALLRGLRTELRDCIVVLDEAHNLPEAARELWSRTLPAEACDAAMAEAERIGDPVCQGLRATQVLRALRRAIHGLAGEYLLDEDGPVPEGELEARLLEELGCASPRLGQAVRGLQEHGAVLREQRRREGQLPRSWLGGCADFLAHWMAAGEDAWVQLVEPGPRLTCALLDAGLAARPLLEARATLHLSGTLAPLEAYREALGLPPNTPLRRFDGVHDPGQRLALFAPDVTTRHEDLALQPALLPRLAARVVELLALGRPAMVCFPSHDLLDRLRPWLPPALACERPGMGQAELMALVEDFRARRVAALGAVMGGRLAEGLDFPGDLLELVVVVGIPYARPTFRARALVAHADARGAPGWEYVVEAPAMRRVAQAAGRLLRGPGDRGVVVVLDRRAHRLGPWMPDLRPSEAPAREAAAFWAAAPAPAPVGS